MGEGERREALIALAVATRWISPNGAISTRAQKLPGARRRTAAGRRGAALGSASRPPPLARVRSVSVYCCIALRVAVGIVRVVALSPLLLLLLLVLLLMSRMLLLLRMMLMMMLVLLLAL